MENKEWYIKPLDTKKIHHGCLNCGGTEDILSMDTVLYNSFGGWKITKNGELFFEEDMDKEWLKNKKMNEIEQIAKKDPDNDWRAIVYLPLRGATYQRYADNKWVCIESNEGFA